MKRKKMLVVVLMIAFFVGSVGLGVHLLYKDAKAENILTCFCFENGGVEELILHCHFFREGQPVDGAGPMEENGGGFYEYDGPPVSTYDSWDISIELGADPWDPLDNPHEMPFTQSHLNWEVREW